MGAVCLQFALTISKGKSVEFSRLFVRVMSQDLSNSFISSMWLERTNCQWKLCVRNWWQVSAWKSHLPHCLERLSTLPISRIYSGTSEPKKDEWTVGLNVRQLAGISIPKDLYKWGQVVVLVLENLCPFFSRSDVWRLQKRVTRLLLAHGVTCQVCLRSWIYCSPLQPKGALLKYKSQLILGWKLYCSVCYVF